MSKEDADFLDDLRSLSIGAAHELLTGIDRLRQLREEWMPVDPGLDPTAVRSRYGDFIYKLARAEVEHAEKVLSLSHEQAELVFQHVRTLVRSARGRSDAPLSPVLELSHSQGERYTGRCEVRNPFACEAFLRFELGPLRDMRGQTVDAANMRATAPSVSVPTRSTLELMVEVELGKPEPGALYYGELCVYLSADVERLVARRMLRLHVVGEVAP